MLRPLLVRPLLLAAVLAAGCGDGKAPAMPTAVLGTYTVDVTSGGKTDPDLMTVGLGSNNNVLLNFTAGISEVRCQLTGSTILELPRQTLHVAHSTGVADGQATGGGTITNGAVDITLHLSTIGFVTDAGAGAVVDYHITGMKQ